MTVDREAFLREAIQTPSHESVTEMRALLVERLSRAGYESGVDERGNVRVTRGTADEPHIVLNSHIDTVAPHVPYDHDGDRIEGRGACDAKGPLAALVEAFCTADIDTGRLTLAVTPDEETAQHGAAHLGDTLDADGYIVGEPTGLDVCPAARGNFGGHVHIHGESAHASNPAEGTNPLRALGPLLEALDRYDHRHGPGEHELLGPPTLEATRIQSDGPLNQTPAKCAVGFDRRTVPPERVGAFVARLESYLDDRLPDAYRFEVAAAYPDSPNPEAFATDTEAPLVRTLAAASGGDVRPFEAATDASYLADNGPTVVFGPGVLADEEGPVAHAQREYVTSSAVEAATDAVRATIERHLRGE